MVELDIKPRLGYLTFTYSTGLNYRIQGKLSRYIYRAVEPLNHIPLTEEPLSCRATKIYAFTCSLNFIFLHPFLRLSYSVNPPLSYPGSRGYFCVVWAGMRKVASVDNRSILYHTCARFVMWFSREKIIMCFTKPIAWSSQESNLPTTLLALLVGFIIFFSMVFSNLATNLLKKKVLLISSHQLFQESIGCQL